MKESPAIGMAHGSNSSGRAMKCLQGPGSLFIIGPGPGLGGYSSVGRASRSQADLGHFGLFWPFVDSPAL